MTPEDPGIQPYPGLRAYEAHENHLFFGRDEQSDELLRRLRVNRFLAVVGTSGSGKSSLVKAGVLPSLYGGFMAKAGSVWRIATLRPGADPIGNLAAALYSPEVFGSDADPESAATASLFAETTLRRGPLGLVEVSRYGRLAPDENLLILVDQFEEIFRFARASGGDHKDDAAGFVKLLLEAARQHEIPIYVILTMRSDFLGDCARFRNLPETINEGQYLVPRLTRDQLREAIVGPASVGGAEIAPRLVQRLLGEVGDDPDQLPILQHALMRTWDIWAEHGRQGPLDIADYEATGGMASALSRHADEAYEELGSDRAHEIARRLFQRLSEKSEDHREIRRPTRLDEICAVVNAGMDEVAAVIEVFRQPGRSFLMPPADVPLTAHTAIDISHESLMRVWTRLKKWVDEEAESAAQYRRLAQSAALAAKGEAGPMTDPELSITLDWRKKWRPNAAWADRYYPGFAAADAFLEKSRELRDADVRASEEHRKRELRRSRRIAAFFGLAFLIAIAFLGFALVQKSEAQNQRAEAVKAQTVADEAEFKAWKAGGDASREELKALQAEDEALQEKDNAETSAEQAQSERQVALARTSAGQSSTTLDDQFDYALLLAMKALDLIGPNQVNSGLPSRVKGDVDASSFIKEHTRQEAQEALLKAVQSRPQLTAYLHGHTAPVNCLTYTRDGKLLASGSDDGAIVLWEVSSHKQIARLTGHLGTVSSVSFSADGTKLASGSTDRTVILWDVASRRQVGRLTGHLGDVTSVSFSSNGKVLATGSADRKVILWDAQSHKQIGSLPSGVPSIQSIGFSPDSTMLAVAGYGLTEIWDILANQPQPKIKPLESSSPQFSFSPDSRTIAYPSGATIVLFDIALQQPLKTSPVVQGTVQILAFSPGGGSVAEGSFNNAAVVYAVYNVGSNRITGQHELVGHSKTVKSVVFSPTGAGLASGSDDGDVILWDPSALSRIGQTLTGVKAGGTSTVSLSPDGKVFVAGNSDGTVSFWNAATAKPAGESVACHSNAVTSLAFNPTGTILASGCADQTVVLLGVGSPGRLAGPLAGHNGPVSYVGFSRDGRSLISSSQDAGPQPHRTALIWDVPSPTRPRDTFTLPTTKLPEFAPDGRYLAFVDQGKIVLRSIASNGRAGQPRELKKNNYQVDGLVFSPDGKTLASRAKFTSDLKSEGWLSGPVILLWNTDDRQSQTPGVLREYQFSGVMTFSPNAKLLAAAADEGISLWDVATRKQVGALMVAEGQTEGQPTDLAFSPDGLTLAAIHRGDIALWDVGTGEHIGRLPSRDASSLSFSRDGSRLLASSARRPLRSFTLWDIDGGSWRARACAVSNRNFTHEEWEHQFGKISKKMPYEAVCPNLPESVAVATVDAQWQAAVHEGENLLQGRHVKEANAAFMKALKFRPPSVIEPYKWNNLCWLGALSREADKVVEACDYAVALMPPGEFQNLDARGVARALNGKVKEAIADFEVYAEKGRADKSMKQQRRDWIDALKAGKNPFTDDLLMKLREQ